LRTLLQVWLLIELQEQVRYCLLYLIDALLALLLLARLLIRMCYHIEH